MHRERAQHEHDKYVGSFRTDPCHGSVRLDETETVSSNGFAVTGIGPWFCSDCDWQEGKKADSPLPDLGTELPKVETH